MNSYIKCTQSQIKRFKKRKTNAFVKCSNMNICDDHFVFASLIVEYSDDAHKSTLIECCLVCSSFEANKEKHSLIKVIPSWAMSIRLLSWCE